MSVKRRTEIYKINIMERNPDIGKIDKKELSKYIILGEYISFYFSEYKHTKDNDRKVTKKSKNICYYIDNVKAEDDIYSVILKYIKFNVSTNVVAIDTLESKYRKAKNEGDEERQHYIIKKYNNTNKAIFVYEKITGAVTVGMINEHMNSAYRKWIKKSYEDDEERRRYLLNYEICIEVIPSPDFIKEIEKMDKISLLKVTVDREKLTSNEDILYAEDNVSRKMVDILYKPIPTLSFSKGKIIKYFEMYQNNKEKIRRLVINGRNNGDSVSLDTERMKLNEFIEANIDIDGLINSEDILNRYKKLLSERFKEYINNIINKEIVLEIDDKEE